MNFQSLPHAYLTLYMALTREGWNEVMNALSMKKSAYNFCIDSPTYQDYVDHGHAIGCGKSTLAVIYFTCYSIVISIVFLSLFVAIVLSGYFASSDKSKKEAVIQLTLKFQRAWSIYDPLGTGKIKDEDFDSFMIKLDRPMGWDRQQSLDVRLKESFKAMIALQMPDHQKDPDKAWYFNEMLD